MTYHLPVLPPTLVAPLSTWSPRESFSPSQLAQYAGEGGCKRKWSFRSVFGVGEAKQSKGRALGSLIHACLEHYLRGGTVYDLVAPEARPGQALLERLRVDEKTRKELASYDPKKLAELADEAPKRALAGLHLVPNTKDPALEVVEVEQWIKLDTSRLIGGVEPIRLNGKIDLSFRRAGVWYLHDHKSTRGRRETGLPFDPWHYCKTPEALAKDPQSVFYGLDRMYRHGIDSIWSRWAYFLTDMRAHPQAHEVDVELRRAVLEPAGYEWLVVANEMRDVVRAAKQNAIAPDDLPPSPDSCSAFGGCPYHVSRGGPCSPAGQVQLGDLISTGVRPVNTGVPHMSLAEKYAATQAALGGAQPPLIPQNPLIPPEAHQQQLAAAVTAAVAPAPAAGLPPLPPGWEYGPGNLPRQSPPPGYQYNAAGQIEAVPPPPAPAPAAPPFKQGDGAEQALAENGAPQAPADEKRGKGRPPGAKNKAKGGNDLSELACEMRAAGVSHVTFGETGTILALTLDLHAPRA